MLRLILTGVAVALNVGATVAYVASVAVVRGVEKLTRVK
jgi:hypothetical protein